MRDVVLGYGSEHEHIEQHRQSEAVGAVTEEFRWTFAIDRSRNEHPRYEEQQAHKERLQVHLPRREGEERQLAYGWSLNEIPVSQGAIRVRGVHADDEQDHRPSEIVDVRHAR